MEDETRPGKADAEGATWGGTPALPRRCWRTPSGRSKSETLGRIVGRPNSLCTHGVNACSPRHYLLCYISNAAASAALKINQYVPLWMLAGIALVWWEVFVSLNRRRLSNKLPAVSRKQAEVGEAVKDYTAWERGMVFPFSYWRSEGIQLYFYWTCFDSIITKGTWGIQCIELSKLCY